MLPGTSPDSGHADRVTTSAEIVTDLVLKISASGDEIRALARALGNAGDRPLVVKLAMAVGASEGARRLTVPLQSLVNWRRAVSSCGYCAWRRRKASLRSQQEPRLDAESGLPTGEPPSENPYIVRYVARRTIESRYADVAFAMRNT